MQNYRPYLTLTILVLASLACQAATSLFAPSRETPTPTLVPTPLPPVAVLPGADHPDEPVAVSGRIPFTSRFFLSTTAEPYVMLEDQTGFVRRDRKFEFPLSSQVIGPVSFIDDQTLSYHLALPAVPQGTQVDVDNDGRDDPGVQVFAIAYWSNTWGDPFLEPRDGRGWSNAYASTRTDPDREDEIEGGYLIIWAPDDRQAFPTSFGPDEALFTPDDPTAPIPAGYSLVDLDQEPFRIFKQAQPVIDLLEGVQAVHDLSDLPYGDAFRALVDQASREYPFQEQKQIDWEALRSEFGPRADQARDPDDFYRVVHEFTLAIPDGHVGVSLNRDVFIEEVGGGFGLVLTELSDGRVLVTDVLPQTPADRAGIQVGAELLEWDGQPVLEAIARVEPYFGPYSTEHHKRRAQVLFLTHVPPDTEVELLYRNPGADPPRQVRIRAEIEVLSLFRGLPSFNRDELALPVEAQVLDDSGLGYIRINTFSGDYNMTARLWDTHLETLIENQIPGLILDLRSNTGGNSGLALDMAGYFFDEGFPLFQRAYYNKQTKQFELRSTPTRLEPGPLHYEGPLAVLIGPECVSACEGFSYALSQGGRAILVGHAPTAGAFGDVGRGQYTLPDELSVQFPTGRPIAPDGTVPIEGTGVAPDIQVPVTEASALGQVDAVLRAAVEALLDEL